MVTPGLRALVFSFAECVAESFSLKTVGELRLPSTGLGLPHASYGVVVHAQATGGAAGSLGQ